MWKYIVWYYNQMDIVFVPSGSTGEELAPERDRSAEAPLFTRGVDVERFHPSKRNGVLDKRYQVKSGFKLFYVGRVSKEKNLHSTGEDFKSLVRSHRELKLVIRRRRPLSARDEPRDVRRPGQSSPAIAGEELAERLRLVRLLRLSEHN